MNGEQRTAGSGPRGNDPLNHPDCVGTIYQ